MKTTNIKSIFFGSALVIIGLLSACGEKECLGHHCDHKHCNNSNKPVPPPPTVTPAQSPN
ncbi:MAG TPA: hypothetical protein VNW06_05160 [Cytophagaceae bacterium]|jgi:hypothetical protein|nr:hypothetical protein [Cytophagaceae bacterium]